MQLFVPYFGVVESVPCYESQHCDKQQFQTLSCVHYTIFSVLKLDYEHCYWIAFLLWKKTTGTPRVHLVHTANKHVAYPKLNINGNNIERATNLNFLGLTISSTLSWNQHINKISLKISKSTGILYRLRVIYPRAALKNL